MGMSSENSAIATLLVQIVGLAGTFIATVAVGAWKLRGMQAKIDKGITDMAATIKQDQVEEHDVLANQMGEGLQAIRQKINDVELWNRDNFVRRTDFQNVIDGFTKSVEGLRTSIDGLRASMDSRLDRAIQEIKASGRAH